MLLVKSGRARFYRNLKGKGTSILDGFLTKTRPQGKPQTPRPFWASYLQSMAPQQGAIRKFQY